MFYDIYIIIIMIAEVVFNLFFINIFNSWVYYLTFQFFQMNLSQNNDKYCQKFQNSVKAFDVRTHVCLFSVDLFQLM